MKELSRTEGCSTTINWHTAKLNGRKKEAIIKSLMLVMFQSDIFSVFRQTQLI